MNKRLSKIELNDDGTVKGLKFQDGEVCMLTILL
jgi:hypothetical protein